MAATALEPVTARQKIMRGKQDGGCVAIIVFTLNEERR
jgi:hypothetical protein